MDDNDIPELVKSYEDEDEEATLLDCRHYYLCFQLTWGACCHIQENCEKAKNQLLEL
jgi:hypothetical protein